MKKVATLLRTSATPTGSVLYKACLKLQNKNYYRNKLYFTTALVCCNVGLWKGANFRQITTPPRSREDIKASQVSSIGTRSVDYFLIDRSIGHGRYRRGFTCLRIRTVEIWSISTVDKDSHTWKYSRYRIDRRFQPKIGRNRPSMWIHTKKKSVDVFREVRKKRTIDLWSHMVP